MNSNSKDRFGIGVIDQLVQDILTTGYLSLEVEKQLRYLLQMTKYSQKDFEAFIKLQHAALDGLIKQESREQMFSGLTLSSPAGYVIL
ncbi:MAG: hypothetical protein WBA77_07960 [Microcoleaceae cyanobacterium]